jgi:hypothetical protein
VNNESQLIQKNKRYNCRNDLWELPSVTISQYLSDKLNFSYGYITNILLKTPILQLRIL